MKGRIEWDGKTSGYFTDWSVLVNNPAKNGYFIEAFSSADAVIDSQLQSILRQVYNIAEAQDLINQLESIRGESQFYGTGILKILQNINIIDKDLANKIKAFKGKRNLVCHTMKAEYSLVNFLDYKDQKTLDEAVEKESKQQLSRAESIFLELIDVSKELYDTINGMTRNQKQIWYHQKRKGLK